MLLVGHPLAFLHSKDIVACLGRTFLYVFCEGSVLFKQPVLKLFFVIVIQTIQSDTDIDVITSLKGRDYIRSHKVRNLRYVSPDMFIPTLIAYHSRPKQFISPLTIFYVTDLAVLIYLLLLSYLAFLLLLYSQQSLLPHHHICFIFILFWILNLFIYLLFKCYLSEICKSFKQQQTEFNNTH